MVDRFTNTLEEIESFTSRTSSAFESMTRRLENQFRMMERMEEQMRMVDTMTALDQTFEAQRLALSEELK